VKERKEQSYFTNQESSGTRPGTKKGGSLSRKEERGTVRKEASS